MGLPSPLKVCSTSSSIKQCQYFLSTDSPWDIERLLSKSALSCSVKIRSYKKTFVDNLTNYI